MPCNKSIMATTATQNMSPVEHLGKSRILTTVVALIALAFILAAIYIFLQPQTRPAIVVDQRALEISQALASLKGAVPATQAEIQKALKQLSASKAQPATQSQIDQALSQLKGQ